MTHDYSYGEYENQLISLFTKFPPNFQKAVEIIHQGANLNARPTDETFYENILADIIYNSGVINIYSVIVRAAEAEISAISSMFDTLPTPNLSVNP